MYVRIYVRCNNQDCSMHVQNCTIISNDMRNVYVYIRTYARINRISAYTNNYKYVFTKLA